MTDRIAIHATIHGRVQGVWYRGWTAEEARTRGLTGWVRNRPDGTVEALFVGPGLVVEDMLAACRTGPPAARVERIETGERSPPPAIGQFEVRR